MTHKTLTLACMTFLVLGGCASDVAGTPDVAVAQAELTLAECAAERDACFASRGLFGILSCNAEYTLCAATADEGLPTAVTTAVASAADCVADMDDCIIAATTPGELAQCAEDRAICVADIVGVELPTIVGDTGECVDHALGCIDGASSVSDLTSCGTDLTACAVEAADNVVTDVIGDIIPEVAMTIDGTIQCTEDSAACIAAATSASELTACAEAQTQCVAGVLDVEIPTVVSASEAVDCAETAAECTLAAESLADIGACADGLLMCAEDLASGVVDCNAQYTQCLWANPLFGLFTCADAYRTCLNN